MADNPMKQRSAHHRDGSSTDHSTDDVQHKAQQATSEAKHKASELASRARSKAEDAAHQAREKVTSQAEHQKERATSRIGGVTEALHQTSDSLRQQDQRQMAGYVDQAAHQVERVEDYLRTHSVTEMLGEAERFARREPALFLGGAMLLGIVGARFLKSSSPEHRQHGHGGPERQFRARTVEPEPIRGFDSGSTARTMPDSTTAESGRFDRESARRDVRVVSEPREPSRSIPTRPEGTIE